MKAKGIDLVLNRDRKGQNEVLEELNQGDDNMAKNNNMYKYFRVIDDQRTEGVNPKEEKAQKNKRNEDPEEVTKDAPEENEDIAQKEAEESLRQKRLEEERQEKERLEREKRLEEERINKEKEETERALEKERMEAERLLALERIAEEARLAEEEKRADREKERLNEVSLDGPKDIDKIETPLIGKEISKEEADEIEKTGDVLKKTILITHIEEEKAKEEKAEDEEPLILKIRKNDKEIVLAEPVYIVGRSDSCDICLLGETYVGRRHAEIEVKGNVVTVRDLNSKNGTKINGVKIDKAVLERGDLLTFADVECFIL